jgi:methylenetetrahydrofolate dehydrogenase (NADP+) / methenyltetrahydrofolate cyclohydrolase
LIVLDGRPIAKRIRSDVKLAAEKFRHDGIIPTLAVVVPTNDGMADAYVRAIVKGAMACAVEARIIKLPQPSTTELIAKEINKLAEDDSVHGIILQTPLPEGTKIDDLAMLIPPAKDVDGVSPTSAGQTLFGQQAFAPATAEAVLAILEEYKIPLEGKHAVIVGRSRVVGKPVAHLLIEKHATVTISHSRTKDIRHFTKQAEVLVVAVGSPGLIKSKDISPDVVVIDVGINVTDSGELVGDVSPDVASVAAALTPVPGGVGPVTTAIILQHTITAVGLHLIR